MYTLFFFFNDTATTDIYTYLHTLSLHYALPIFFLASCTRIGDNARQGNGYEQEERQEGYRKHHRSEEHTSDPVTNAHLVCRLLLEKKKKNKKPINRSNIETNRELSMNEQNEMQHIKPTNKIQNYSNKTHK